MYVPDSSWLGIPAISALIGAVLLLLFYGLKQRKNLPPGPPCFPLIGCLPFIATRLYRTGDDIEHLFAKLADEYGEVFTLKIGSTVVVVVNGYNSIKEAFTNPQLNDRPSSKLLAEVSMDTGVALTSGKTWQHQRKFTKNTLRGFGVGTNIFEGQISCEAETLIDEMPKNEDKPFQIRNLINKCVANVICSFVFGKRFNHADPKFEYIMNIMTTLFEKFGTAGLLMLFIPITKYLFPQSFRDLKSAFHEVVGYVKNNADEHAKVFEETNEVNDFIDVFLREIELSKTDVDRSDIINRKSLVGTCVTLFQAGTETATITLSWMFLYMIMYPDVQAKVQEEMDRVVGRQRMPQWADRNMLPYTEAVLHEIQRIRTVVPLSVPHFSAENTQIAGYDVPKDAIIISNLWAVHNDPAVWPEPDQFKPERFLDENGKLRVPKDYMPFGIGRRICLGENLAKMQVFLFFTYVFHKCAIKKSPGCSYSLKTTLTGPAPYEIVAESRE